MTGINFNDLLVGDKYTYRLIDANKNEFDFYIIEVNKEIGWIRILNTSDNLSNIYTGLASLICILNLNKIIDFDNMLACGYEFFPDFHDFYMQILYNDSMKAHFRFIHRANYIDVIIDDIIDEHASIEKK